MLFHYIRAIRNVQPNRKRVDVKMLSKNVSVCACVRNKFWASLKLFFQLTNFSGILNTKNRKKEKKIRIKSRGLVALHKCKLH